MSRVFVAQDDGRHSLTDARRFGDIVVVYRKDLFPDNANEQVPAALKRAYEMLDDFDPDNDFFCIVGSPLYTGLCSYVLGDLGKAPVTYLRWDRLERAYYPVKLQ